MLKVEHSAIQEQRDLVVSGDLVLDDERKKFRNYIGRATQLDDDKLLIACAALSDDDTDEFCGHVIKVENGQYEITGTPPAAAQSEVAA